MELDVTCRDEAEQLIVLHGAGAIGTLVSRIADAVSRCDDQAVGKLDHMLQWVEGQLEAPWRLPAQDAASGDAPAIRLQVAERL